MRKRYRLDYAEPYTVKESMLKNSTHQTYRWKTIAVCDDLEELKSFMKEEKEQCPYVKYRIEDTEDFKCIYRDAV